MCGGLGGGGGEFVEHTHTHESTRPRQLDAVVQYAGGSGGAGASANVERVCFVRGIANAARDAGFDAAIERLVPLILQLMADSDAAIRAALAEQLPELASFFVGHAEGYTEVLGLLQVTAELLADEDEEVLGSAEVALVGIARHLDLEDVDNDVNSVLEVLASHEEEEKRMAAARAVSRLCASPAVLDARRAASHATPMLISLADDPAFRVRKCVALAVPSVATAAGEAHASGVLAPLITKLGQDSFWAVRQAVAEALPLMADVLPDSTRAPVLAPLAAALIGDENPSVEMSAKQSLGKLLARLGEDSPPALLHAFAALGADSGVADVQLACAESLADVVRSAPTLYWPLLRESHGKLCASVRWNVRRAIARSLACLAACVGEADADACVAPALEAMLADVTEVQRAAVEVFADTLAALSGQRALELLAEHLPALAAAPTRPADVCVSWRSRASLANRIGVLASLGARAGVSPSAALAVVRTVVLPASLALVTDPVAAVRDAAASAAGDWANALAVVDACACGGRSGGGGGGSAVAQRRGLPATYRDERSADVEGGEEGSGDGGGLLDSAVSALQAFALSPKHVPRATYAALCASMARAGGAAGEAVRRTMLPLMLELAEDPVPNVRLAVAHALWGSGDDDGIEGDEVAPLGALPDARFVLGNLAGDIDGGVREAALGGPTEAR